MKQALFERFKDYNVEYAWRVINNYNLTPNGNGEKFITDYELAVLKLIDENEVVSDKMKRIFF